MLSQPNQPTSARPEQLIRNGHIVGCADRSVPGVRIGSLLRQLLRDDEPLNLAAIYE